jgi:endonuclease YncB( thermonuclease family)
MTDWVRLEGLDAPEVIWPGVITASQPYGRAAGDSVRNLIKGKTVGVEWFGYDKLNRPLVRLTLQDGRDLADVILRKGWAWYERNDLDAVTRRRYQRSRNYARERHLGLWADPAAVSPDHWHATHQPNVKPVLNPR